MTFLENIKPLLKAAEEYAIATAVGEPKAIEARAAELQKAAVEYAKWGRIPRKEKRIDQ